MESIFLNSKDRVEIETRRESRVFAKEILVIVRTGKGDCVGDKRGNLWMREHFESGMKRNNFFNIYLTREALKPLDKKLFCWGKSFMGDKISVSNQIIKFPFDLIERFF